jgi:hypothetical protein
LIYTPNLGRFIQADTLVAEPGNPLDWDRYAYVYNNPLIYTDPSGHKLDPFGDDFGGRNVVQLGGVYLKGGPGTPYNGFAVEAEEEYTDHSGGGYSLPAFESISLANLFLVWLRDNTPAREWLGNSLPGVFGTPEVYGQVFYDDTKLEGIRVTGVSITNDTYEDIMIRDVQIEIYSQVGNSMLRDQSIYPYQHTSLSSQNYGIAEGKSWSGIVSVTSPIFNPIQYAIIKFRVISESRRWATFTGKIQSPANSTTEWIRTIK